MRVVRWIGSIPLDEENGDNGKLLSVTGRWRIRSGESQTMGKREERDERKFPGALIRTKR